MSLSQIKVSVIIPVYNVEKYLRECLDSVIDQTLKEIEIICVDDCSPDNSIDILNEYAAKDSRIKIFRNEQNKGLAASRNVGIKHAEGEYIGFIDSDDFISSNYFEELYKKALEHDADISCTSRVLYYPSLTEKPHPRHSRSSDGPQTLIFSTLKEKKRNLCWDVVWNKIYKRTFLQKYNILFPINHYEDGPFTFMTTCVANSIVEADTGSYFYRLREDSITNVKWGREIFVRADAFPLIEDFIKNSKTEYWLPVYKEWAASRIASIFYRFNDNQTREAFCSYVKEAGLDFECPQILPEAIISFTSYPGRIHSVDQVALSLLNQDIPSKKVILWLADSQFPNREADLPEALLALREHGLSIEWCEDIRSYKKLIPALEKYPDDIIVTADDDIIYPSDWLRRLVAAYIERPDMLHSLRSHELRITSGNLAPYASWRHEVEEAAPSFCNFCTSGGGVLYKKELLHNDILKKDIFLKVCPDADDIWFWGMAVLRGTRINLVSPSLGKLSYVEGSQDDALWRVNLTQNANDQKLKNIMQSYPNLLAKVKYDHQKLQRKRLFQRFTRPWLKKKKEGEKKYYLFGVCLFSKTKTSNRKRLSLLGIPLYSIKREGGKTTRRILFIRYSCTDKAKSQNCQ